MSRTTQTKQKRVRWTDEDVERARKIAGRRMTADARADVDANAVLLRASRLGMEAIERCPTCTAALACAVHWTEPAGEPVAASPAKPEKPEKEKAYQRYARAYAEGQEHASGQTFAALTDSGAQHAYRTMATGYAKDGKGAPLNGDALLAWFRVTSAAYRRACADKAQYQSGFHPRSCLKWLGSGGTKARSNSTRQEAPAGGASYARSKEQVIP